MTTRMATPDEPGPLHDLVEDLFAIPENLADLLAGSYEADAHDREID